MIPAPNNVAELSQILAGANSRKEKIERVDLSKINRVIEHTPGDMTATVETGITLAEFQKRIGQHGQWLAIDPPNAETATIADIINANTSGPRRFGLGTIRDYLLGLTAVLADGTVIHSGGKVVKNVAGYDLMKLFIGGQGTAGVVVEATFKLRPLPEAERFVCAECGSSDEASKLIESVVQSEVTPQVFDLYGEVRQVGQKPLTVGDLPFQKRHEPERPTGSVVGSLTVVLGFAGTREEVEWQLERVKGLGFTKPGSLDYETSFWNDARPLRRVSVLPSKLMEHINGLNEARLVARVGNGIIYYRDDSPAITVDAPKTAEAALGRRIKDAYDPNHIFPELSL